MTLATTVALPVPLHATSVPLHAVALVALVVMLTTGAGLGDGCGGGVVSTRSTAAMT